MYLLTNAIDLTLKINKIIAKQSTRSPGCFHYATKSEGICLGFHIGARLLLQDPISTDPACVISPHIAL